MPVIQTSAYHALFHLPVTSRNALHLLLAGIPYLFTEPLNIDAPTTYRAILEHVAVDEAEFAYWYPSARARNNFAVWD